MIQKIRTSRATKIIAMYLALTLVVEIIAPMKAYALTGGPEQPEFSAFTPISTSDMVDLSSGDFSYNIPIMDVGGYPINLAYNSNVTMDQEASWVGLGWDLSVGQINRQMRGLPDDFNGDEMIYENNLKDNVTVGGNIGIDIALFGHNEDHLDESTGDTIHVRTSTVHFNGALGVTVNNYTGFDSSLSVGLNYTMAKKLNIGFNMNSSASDGVNVSPSLSFTGQILKKLTPVTSLTGSLGTNLNSRKGIQYVTIGSSLSQSRCLNNRHRDGSASLYSSSLSFIDASYTPSKRVGMKSSNYTFNANIQGEFWGTEPVVKFGGFRSKQGVKKNERYKTEKGYGYEYSLNASDEDIMDFNREKDRTFSNYTVSLPVVNYTYDLYTIQGQGIGGMFRPYKSQVDYVHDNKVEDESDGGSLGIELGFGGGSHWGGNIEVTRSKSATKTWRSQNLVVGKFEKSLTNNKPNYEPVFFKTIGGNHVDYDYNDFFVNKLGAYKSLRHDLGGGKFSRSLNSHIVNKNPVSLADIEIKSPIKRTERLKRNLMIQKLTRKEAIDFGFDTRMSPYSKAKKHDNHTTAIHITKEGGERYIYGRAAYNIKKKEMTFDVSGGGQRIVNGHTGLVDYLQGSDNTGNNNAEGDQFVQGITTPEYAHSYLLTSVLSSDYSDLTGNGPSDDDLGSYTKFVYNHNKTINTPYKWRIPYAGGKANYDEGLKSSRKDDKGNYIYGEREQLYLDTIVTKTHIAIFEISPRKDGFGVNGENGGGDATTLSKMYKLDKITLYSKAEFQTKGAEAIPIKTAHFVYDYELCKGVPNNFNSALTDNELRNEGGKLTLQRVYFTYGKSNMGKYTPYKFTYDTLFNKNYDQRACDSWGNYKPNLDGSGTNAHDLATNAEYPYVEQNKQDIDKYANAWRMKMINLPSGGKINVEFESDEYKYVQDKEAMQMFQVVGVGTSMTPGPDDLHKADLFDSDVLYIKLNQQGMSQAEYISLTTTTTFKEKYIKTLINDPVYFRFLLNMSKDHEDRYDYVTGYLELKDEFKVFSDPNGSDVKYAAIRIKKVNKGDGFNSGVDVNPISKAGWHFGRENLNNLVYNNPNDETVNDLGEIIKNLVRTVPNMLDIFKSPNKQLMLNGIASRFISGKAFIRLMNPTGRKYGGGSRVKSIKLSDEWQVMANHNGDPNYGETYGQVYSYDNTDGSTSGVATYEPLGSKENPLVQPIYDKNNKSKLLGPEDQNYIEKPFGESFFPSPTITYGRVTVKNLPREMGTGNSYKQVKKHATGNVVTEFFTTKDYPTIVDYTDMAAKNDKSSVLAGLLKLNVREHITASQGFMVHTNDMNGKMKKQEVYAEGQSSPISSSKYIYDELSVQQQGTKQGKLNNVVTTIDRNGKVEDRLVGVDYEVMNDFRENTSETTSAGINVNIAVLPITVFPIVVPTPIPSYQKTENQMRTAVITKVIHSTGILREVQTMEDNSFVYSRNLAWDAETGEVLLTETINEFNDKYYSFNYPAYWGYDAMGQSAMNIGMNWRMNFVGGPEYKYKFEGTQYKASDYLVDGDEIWVKPDIMSTDEANEIYREDLKAYVIGVNGQNFSLITEDGHYVKQNQLANGEFTVIRSGRRNMQTASMASITSMINPLTKASNGKLPSELYRSDLWSDYRIINASAIEYKDEWAAQCECYLPRMQYDAQGNLKFDYNSDYTSQYQSFNPYKYNVKGNWRPNASYAYLTSRNSFDNASVRNSGYYSSFHPFYSYNSTTKKWNVNVPYKDKWQFASEVTQYSPQGFELENKDALGNYSSALYGYNYRFPIAVAANAQYRELAYDGFEDYGFTKCDTTAHFSAQGALKPYNVEISTRAAHTGKSSLRVLPGQSAVIKKQIVPCTNQTGN